MKAADSINPTYGWCYAGEDFMHKVKHLAAASLKGGKPLLANVKMMAKYVRGISLSFADEGRFFRK
eukprot:14436265-Alexandrium_andersonii.AAC.1